MRRKNRPAKANPGLAAGLLTVPLSVALFTAGLPVSAQSSLVNAPTSSVVLGFNGGYSLNGGSGTQATPLQPPDTMGAVGASQFAVFQNGGYAVYNKTTGTLQGTLQTDANFWSAAGLGGSISNGLSDTRILFDATTSRWFASEITTNQNAAGFLPNQFLVAVSNSADLTGGFKGYAFNSNPAAGSQNLFADYDTLGINSQGIYLGALMFNAAGNAAFGTDELVISKTDLLNNVGSPTSTLVYDSALNSTGATAHPVVDLDNGGTAANNGGYFLSDYNTPAGRNAVSQLNGTVGAATLTASGGNVTVTAYAKPVLATQLGTTGLIAAGDSRFGSAPVKLNGIIYATQTVQNGATGLDAIHLVGINASTKAVVLDQLISDPALNYYYPSIAINTSGQVVIGFTSSGAAQYASSSAVVGQLNAAGTAVTFGSAILLHAGTGPYGTSGSGLGRWGDYSNTVIDPNDSSKFWTIQEFAMGTNNWSTWVSEISIAAPEPSEFAALGLGALGLGLLGLKARRRRGTEA